MFCKNCGREVEDSWVQCPYCTTVLKETDDTSEQQKLEKEKVRRNREGNKIINKRSFWKYILLTAITCGIYGIYAMYTFTEDINSLCEGDERKSPNYIIVLLLSLCTCGIYGIYWWYKQAERLKDISSNYGVFVKERGITILCWQIFGGLLFGIGPFVAIYIMFDNVNRLALVYNGEKTATEIQEMGEAHPKLVRNVIITAGVILSVYILLMIIMVMGAALFIDEDTTEEDVAVENVELSEMDLENFIGKSEEEIQELGFEENEDYLGYVILDGAVEITCTDGKVDSIIIHDEGEDIPALHGVKIGMKEEEANELLLQKYPEVIEAPDGKMLLNLENQGSVRYKASEGKISSLVYMTLSDEMMSEYEQAKKIEEAEKEEALKSEYIFPDSDKKYLSEDEVRKVEAEKLAIGRNEIFARHGYIFKSEDLRKHFESTSWYEGTVPADDFNSDSVFNDFEKKNVELIKRVEDEVSGTQADEFIGLGGVYICTTPQWDDFTGKIELGEPQNGAMSFSMGLLEQSYSILTGSAVILDSNTAQIRTDGITITLSWSNSENIYVTSEINFDGMDAGTIEAITDGMSYIRPTEFNQW